MSERVTESRNPRSGELDRLSSLELVQLMNAEDRSVAEAVGAAEQAIATGVDTIAGALKSGGRLIYVGAGTSGRLGVLDASECPPTFGTPREMVVGIIAGGPEALVKSLEGAEDDARAAEDKLRKIGCSAADVVCGISASGRTPFVLAAVRHGKELGATTLGVTCNPDTALAAHVDIPIEILTGPEVLTGSTRLKAGTATKMVLNMLTTAAMVRLGRTAGNLMIDLNPACEKLKVRRLSIVCELTGLDAEAAEQLLERCGGEPRTAVHVHQHGVSCDEARRALREAH